MNAAGLSVASWYAQALDLSAKGPRLRVVDAEPSNDVPASGGTPALRIVK
jgi:hypothetical protein